MADRSARNARRPGRALLPLLVGMAFAPASHADVKVTPSVSLTETWSDNPGLAPSDQTHGRFISDLTPGLTITDNTPRLQLNASYRFHAFAYSGDKDPSLQSNTGELQANLTSRLVEDFLFLDASAARNQLAVSPFGPPVEGNLYSGTNRTEVSTWRVSPYVARSLGASANLFMRYTHDSVRANVIGYGNSESDDANVSLASKGDERLGWSLLYDHQQLNDKLAGDSTSSNATARLSWRLRPGFSLTGSTGYDSFDYHALGGRTKGRSWSVGFAYTPSSRSSLTMSIGHRYFGASRALSAIHRSRHTVWNLSYDEGVTTTRQQFLLPASIDTASMLDRLFSSSIADPDLRRQAVDTYIKMTGLPPSLANNINYLSNRYMLQKQFTASVALTGARSTLVLAASDVRRNALSIQQTDSQLLGSSLSNLYDNVHQRGLAANLSYRTSSRTDAVATADVSHSESLDTGVRQNNRGLRLGLRHQFERKMTGAVELRHLRGSYDSNQNYTENAISATLTSTF